MDFLDLIKGFFKRLRRGKPTPAEESTSKKAGEKSEAVRRPNEENLDHGEAKEKVKGPVESKCIAVVGRTGSGLSQFIHDATSEYDYTVVSDSSVTPGTRTITPVEACIGGRNVTLIDTPGFVYSPDGGSAKLVREALRDLVDWIKKKKVKLDGIIWVHDIGNEEILNKPGFTLPEELEKLCDYSKIIFVTSRWNELESRDKGKARERKFKEEYWRLMHVRGSQMRRYESPGGGQAREILESLWD